MAQTKIRLADTRNPVQTTRAHIQKAKFDLMDDLMDAMGAVTYVADGAIDPHISLAILRSTDALAMTLADATMALETIHIKNGGSATARVVVATMTADTGTEIDLAAGEAVKLIWDGSAWNRLGHASAGGSVTIAGHGLSTGAGPYYYKSTATYPGGLAAVTPYYLIARNANEIEFATSHANALAGIPITLTSDGSGTQTLTKLIDISVVDDTTDEFATETAHGVPDETKVQIEALTGGTLPDPLVAATDYYTIVGGDTSAFQLAASALDAAGGTQIDLQDAGDLPLRLLYLSYKTVTAVNHS